MRLIIEKGHYELGRFDRNLCWPQPHLFLCWPGLLITFLQPPYLALINYLQILSCPTSYSRQFPMAHPICICSLRISKWSCESDYDIVLVCNTQYFSIANPLDIFKTNSTIWRMIKGSTFFLMCNKRPPLLINFRKFFPSPRTLFGPPAYQFRKISVSATAKYSKVYYQ